MGTKEEIASLLADDAFGQRLAALRKAGGFLLIESGKPLPAGVYAQTVIIRPASKPGSYSIAGVRLRPHSISTERTATPLPWGDGARAILSNVLGAAGDWTTSVIAPGDRRVAFVERFAGKGQAE